MHFALSFCLLSFVVFQQSIGVESSISPIHSADNAVGRSNIARRLRAPLMGRSLLSVSSFNDGSDVGYLNHESSSGSSNDDDDILILNKRRPGVPLFGRRWIPPKRRGPLFG